MVDRIVRHRNGSGWFAVTPNATFPAKSLSAVAAGGGHTHTTIYVISNGSIYRADFGPSGVSSSPTAWVKASTGITSAFDVFVDPYDGRTAYATDTGAAAIKETTNGGQTWSPDAALTSIGTNNGEYRVSCPNGGGAGGSFDQSCLLSDVVFLPRSHWRFAVTFPGGIAFSRDDGHVWIPLRGIIDPIDRPYSAFFDRFFTTTGSVTGRSLFVGLRGRGIIRITADWAHLRLAP
jgi:hypothetical protein